MEVERIKHLSPDVFALSMLTISPTPEAMKKNRMRDVYQGQPQGKAITIDKTYQHRQHTTSNPFKDIPPQRLTHGPLAWHCGTHQDNASPTVSTFLAALGESACRQTTKHKSTLA